MIFDYLEYISNNPLLEEVPKNKWVDLGDKEKKEYEEDIFDLIQKAYDSIGGHPNYQKAQDVTTSQGGADYEVIDLDDKPDIDAVNVSKQKKPGQKMTALGHDGSAQAKKEVLRRKINLLKKPGFYVEASGKIKDIFIAKGVPVVTNEDTIRKVMKGKSVEISPEGDGSYTREINGKKFKKILLGKPLV